jgi:hypothetical protein
MPVVVKPNTNIRHNGLTYEAGQVIEDIDDAARAELVKLGVVNDTDNPVGHGVDLEAHPDAAIDPDLAVDQTDVQSQTVANAQQDVNDAEATLEAPGEPVGPEVNSTTEPQTVPVKSGIAKAVDKLTGK